MPLTAAPSLRVAFAGTAHVHARDYARAVGAVPGVRLVGACGVDPEAPAVLGRDVPLVSRIAELPPHDLLIGAGDVVGHLALAEACRAPHLFLEKPLGTDGAHARAVAEAVRAGGARFHTGHFLRGCEGVGAMRKWGLTARR